ncbi:MAG: immunoglobulin domain-containing protein, partial [Verrucomicrobiales bacterium]|nr:immunoglobulin domain-containing protein [Verrucomicrobiales bacterium]
VIVITQSGCSITYRAESVDGNPRPFAENPRPRSGSVNGANVALNGTTFFPLPTLADREVTSRTTSASGTVSGNRITLNGTGDVRTSAFVGIRFTWTSSVVLDRIVDRPTIVEAPTNQTVFVGARVTLSVRASGSDPLTYQWRFKGQNLAAQTGTTLVIDTVQAKDAGEYTVVVSNSAGTATGGPAVLTVKPLPPPTLWEERWEVATVGSSMPGGEIPTVIGGDQGQWFLGDTVSNFPECGPNLNRGEIVNESGRKALKLVAGEVTNGGCAENVFLGIGTPLQPLAVPLVPGVQISFFEKGELIAPSWRSGSFNCLLRPCADSVHLVLQDDRTNQVVYLFQRAPDYVEHAVINTGPSSPGYLEVFLDPGGGTLGGTLGRDLYADFARIAGPAGPGLFINAIEFEVGSTGWAMLDDLRIGPNLLNVPPVIGSQPQSQNANAGSTVTFSVLAEGIGPLTYQWLQNGVPLASAINSTVVLTDVERNDAGDYSVRVSNRAGSVTSIVAVLRINTPPNISPIPDVPTVAGLPIPPISFSAGDAETGAADLVFEKNSTNVALLPLSGITITRQRTSWQLNLTPIPEKTGVTLVTIRVVDPEGSPEGLSATSEFRLTVDPRDPRFRFTSIENPVGRSSVTMKVNGLADLRFAIETSTDLKVWQPVSTNSLATGELTYEESMGTHSQRFYRARHVAVGE